MTAGRPSYPYLDIAKRFGVDYGLVLSYADALDRISNEVPCRFTCWEQKAIEFVETEPYCGIGLGAAVRVARALEHDAQAAAQAAARER